MAKKVKFNNNYLKKFDDKYLDKFLGVDIQIANPEASTYNITYSLSAASITSPDPAPTTISTNETITFVVNFSYSYYTYFDVTNATKTHIDGNTYQVSNPTGDVTINIESEDKPLCLLKGTDVLLADGTTKKIEDITYDDLVLTYNPYLQQFIGEYPCIITENPDYCINYIKKINLENGVSLSICGGHNILVYENNEYHFKFISASEDDNSIIGLKVGLYNNGKFTPSEIISYEDSYSPSGSVAYNVFVPMQGNIITNNIVSGGNLLISPEGEILIHKNILNYNKTVIDSLSTRLIENNISIYHENFKELIGIELPINIFSCCYILYGYLLNNYVEFTDKQTNDLFGLFKGWSASYKTFNSICKIKIDNNIYEVNKGEAFKLPNTYKKYFDTSNYKYYEAGEEKIVYTNAVLVGINDD